MDINTYENDEKELEAEFEEFEEDFEIEKADYQVWIFGYNEDDQITDFEFSLFSSKNPDEAVAYAKHLVENEDVEMITELIDIPGDVAYLGVEVEEVVEVEGVETNQGSIYHGNILVKKEI